MIQNNEKICPRCGAAKVKDWENLDDQERDMVERLYHARNKDELRNSRICTRCWHRIKAGYELV